MCSQEPTATAPGASLTVKAVKAHGGTFIVQDPDTAQFQSMPLSAISTGLVDLVLPLDNIAPTIARLVQRRDW